MHFSHPETKSASSADRHAAFGGHHDCHFIHSAAQALTQTTANDKKIVIGDIVEFFVFFVGLFFDVLSSERLLISRILSC